MVLASMLPMQVRWQRRAGATVTLAMALAVTAACGPTDETCANPDIVVGLLADPVVAATAGEVRITGYDESGEIGRMTKSATEGALFPLEFPLHPHGGQRLRVLAELRYDATRGGTVQGPSGLSLLATQEADVAPGCGVAKQLLRMEFRENCLGVFCRQSETCLAGACVASAASAGALEPYTNAWSAAPDACAPKDGGAPEITLGTGQTDYLATAPDTTVAVEAGPQGGYHVWVSVRTKGLHERAVTVTLNAQVDGSTIQAPMQRTVFSLRSDEGGYCKLFGLRYQLDGAAPISAFLGKPLLIKAELKDSAGLIARDELRVMIAQTLLAP